MASAGEAARRLVRAAANSVGLEVTRRPGSRKSGSSLTRAVHGEGRLHAGTDPDIDIQYLLTDVAHPMVFDVGANIGQSITRFTGLLPGCQIHAFEPSPRTFHQLRANTKGVEQLHLVNAGVGSVRGSGVLFENEYSDMSSFLQPDDAAWGQVVQQTAVDVLTLDDYCSERAIEHIDLLKIDTQGYDFEVLKGAEGLLGAGGIRLVLMEVIFSDMYVGQPPFDEVYRYLIDHDLRLVAFYGFSLRNMRASWSDALFVRTRGDDLPDGG